MLIGLTVGGDVISEILILAYTILPAEMLVPNYYLRIIINLYSGEIRQIMRGLDKATRRRWLNLVSTYLIFIPGWSLRRDFD